MVFSLDSDGFEKSDYNSTMILDDKFRGEWGFCKGGDGFGFKEEIDSNRDDNDKGLNCNLHSRSTRLFSPLQKVNPSFDLYYEEQYNLKQINYDEISFKYRNWL